MDRCGEDGEQDNLCRDVVGDGSRGYLFIRNRRMSHATRINYVENDETLMSSGRMVTDVGGRTERRLDFSKLGRD